MNDLNFKELFSKSLKSWPWFILSMALMLLLSYIYLARTQSVYKVQASLLLQDETKISEQNNLLNERSVVVPKKSIENEIELLRSLPLSERVVNKLNLNIRYFRITTFGKQEIYEQAPLNLIVEREGPDLYKHPLNLSIINNHSVRLDTMIYPLERSVQTPYGQLRFLKKEQSISSPGEVLVEVSDPSIAANNLVLGLKIEPTTKTSSVVLLTLEETIPLRGEKILNQLIEEYNKTAIYDKNKISQNTLNFVEERLRIISGELNAVEKDVEKYKSSYGINDLGEEAKLFLQSAQRNDGLLNQVNIQLATLNDLQKYITNQTDKNNGAPATVGLNDPTLISLINNLTQLELQRDQLVRISSAQSPVLQALDSQIKSTKSKMAGNISAMKSMLLSSQRQYKVTNEQLAGQIRTIPQKERSLMNITRQQTIKNELYTYLLKKREETAVSLASISTESRVVNPAKSSPIPVRPAKTTIYALFGILGILLPFTVIASKSAINDRVLRRVDVEYATQTPILCEIGRNDQKGLISLKHFKRSLVAEQIHTLRVNLQHLQNKSKSSQVLLFTSSISGEGKSFISLNVGISFASVNKTAVVLDMDFRRPKLHKVFNVNNDLGISDYILGCASLDEILKPVPEVPNYYILTSGRFLDNPVELLSSSNVGKLIQELCERFDFIIIDSPPVGLVSDAQMIAPFADMTLFIVRHDVTTKNSLKMLNQLHQSRRFSDLNIILNDVANSDSYYSSNYKSNYSYYRNMGKNS